MNSDFDAADSRNLNQTKSKIKIPTPDFCGGGTSSRQRRLTVAVDWERDLAEARTLPGGEEAVRVGEEGIP